jgi:FkbM family methyltransferase
MITFKDIKNYIKYQQYAFSAIKPRFDRSLTSKEGYRGQFFQDKWISETIFPQLRGGIFIGFGAHDGITFSNTYFLEKELGWSGIAIEPIPHVFEELKKNRNCQLINACISATPGKAKFYQISGYGEMLSGLYDEYDSKHLQRIEREIKNNGGSYEIQDVDCYSLNQILRDYNISHIDYLNMDIEGAEMSILKTIDFDAFDISVIGCENNYKDFHMPQFMESHGYALHSILGDEFYIKTSLIPSIKLRNRGKL